MKETIFKPNKRKILSDILVVGFLFYFSILINAGVTLRSLPMDVLFIVGIGAVYMFIMGFLPLLKITDTGEIVYRSDSRVTHRIKIAEVKRITKAPGFLGHKKALFIHHGVDPQHLERTKIKITYFNREDILNFVREIKSWIDIETNQELEDYLASEKYNQVTS